MSSEATISTPVKESKSDLANNKMLGLIIKQVSDKGLDWEAIAAGMPLDKADKPCTIAAVKERWRRYKINNGMATVKTPAAAATGEPSASKKPTPKAKSATKRKAAPATSDIEEEDHSDLESETPRKKKGKTAVAVAATLKVEESNDELPSESEEHVEVVTPTKPKKTPAKKAAAAKKETPGKKTTVKKDGAAAASAKKATPAKSKAQVVKSRPVVEKEESVDTDIEEEPKVEAGVAKENAMDVDTDEKPKPKSEPAEDEDDDMEA